MKDNYVPRIQLEGTALESAQLAWEGLEGTNEEIARDYGVSTAWFYRRFGPRRRPGGPAGLA